MKPLNPWLKLYLLLLGFMFYVFLALGATYALGQIAGVIYVMGNMLSPMIGTLTVIVLALIGVSWFSFVTLDAIKTVKNRQKSN